MKIIQYIKRFIRKLLGIKLMYVYTIKDANGNEYVVKSTTPIPPGTYTFAEQGFSGGTGEE